MSDLKRSAKEMKTSLSALSILLGLTMMIGSFFPLAHYKKVGVELNEEFRKEMLVAFSLNNKEAEERWNVAFRKYNDESTRVLSASSSAFLVTFGFGVIQFSYGLLIAYAFKEKKEE